ncbi:patatin-like phospholipase family protein [Dokdonella sp.]|uniref:patatin-like phospholipase family protein n=1 Tax=Dokdonella sp. TaxID=2291710 RepID=UPI00262C7149|nr:patatin-like phospholipase family protein [Dokdonella sp.]
MPGSHPPLPPFSFALQGGGAHGAFTWGVLDRLLEEPDLAIDGVSATSSGAMNALALAQGWIEGGRDGARATLEALWQAVATQSNPLRWGLGSTLLSSWAHHFTPEQINPLGLNPLRALADRLFDFERLRAETPFKLFVAATRVRDGALKLFGNHELSLDALLASTCLPQLFAAVVIDDEAYWDGGYAGNPALEPLVYRCQAPHVVCVLVQPLSRPRLPASAREITERIAELGFSTTFLREYDSLVHAQAALRGSVPLSALGRRMKALRLHLIEPGDSLAEYRAKTSLNTEAGFLAELRDLGREAAGQWLLRLRSGT